MSAVPPAVERRLAELAGTYGLSPTTVASLGIVLRAVADDPAAPTTVTEPARAVDVHVADSLSGLELDAVRDAITIADLGAGAGFPGLVLAAALPRARVALVESVSRKCAFLERTAHAAGLANAGVVCARAEAWPAGAGRCDLVTARAVAPLDVLVEYAAPLLRHGGALVAWKGARDRDEEAAGARAAAAIGLDPAPPIRVAPFAGAEHRHLHLYLKVAPTPSRFPRRPGMARKRPLGASSRA